MYLVAKWSLGKFKIAEPRNSITSNFLSCFSFQSHFLDVELHHSANRISRCNLTIDPWYAKLRFDSIEIPSGYFNFNGGYVPTLMPSKSWIIFMINSFLHGNLNVEFSLWLVFLKLNSVFWFQNLKHLVLILLAGPFEGEIAIHPSPLFAGLLHSISTFLIVIHNLLNQPHI